MQSFRVEEGDQSDTVAHFRKWQETWNIITEDRFLDFSRFDKEGEIDWQLRTVENYLVASTNCHTYMGAVVDRLKNQ